MPKTIKRKPRAGAVAAYAVLILAMAVVLSLKANYYVDEIHTYGQANHPGSKNFTVRDGQVYEPADAPFLSFVTVAPGRAFDYGNVWHNTAQGVHPPLYHTLVHTVCSLFPGRFSLWFAGAVNMAFCALTLFFLRRLGRLMLRDGAQVELLSFAFALSGGVLTAVSYLRMYVMAMCQITALTFFFVRADREGIGWGRFLLQAGLAVFLGTLTHYYCAVYAVLMAAVYGIRLLRKREWKRAGTLALGMAASGGAACAVYPAMLRHIFRGSRGKDVLGNAGRLSDAWERLRIYAALTDSELFGRAGVLLAVLAAAYALLILKDRGKAGRKAETGEGAPGAGGACRLLILPTLLYFAVVSKITSVDFLINEFSGTMRWIDRYMFPIYANLLLISALLLFGLAGRPGAGRRARTSAAGAVLCGMSVLGWFTCGWPYLYRDSVPFLEETARYADTEAVCFYTDNWILEPMLLEAGNYRSIQFCAADNEEVKAQVLQRIGQLADDDVIVALVGIRGEEQKAWLEEVRHAFGQESRMEKLGSFGYGTSWHFKREPLPGGGAGEGRAAAAPGNGGDSGNGTQSVDRDTGL